MSQGLPSNLRNKMRFTAEKPVTGPCSHEGFLNEVDIIHEQIAAEKECFKRQVEPGYDKLKETKLANFPGDNSQLLAGRR